MKKKIFSWLSIFFVAALCVGFASCGGGDDDGDDTGQTTGGGSGAKEDFGSDGLKGFWVQNNWKEIVLERWYYYTPTYIMGLKGGYDWDITATKGQATMMIYLDGEGGGTMHTSVTTLDRVNNDSKFVSANLGAFYDTADGSTKEYYSLDKYYRHERYSDDSSRNTDKSFNYNNDDNILVTDKESALTYYVTGSTIEIFYDDTTKKIDLNVSTGSNTSAGSVSNYHRLKKTN